MEKLSVDELLKKDLNGKIVCFPTDTVYGVGALVSDEIAINKIYAMKHRDPNKPLAILTGNYDIKQYVESISDSAFKMMETYWPGALTIIFKRSNLLNISITKGIDTIAFRMPNSKTALKILNHFGLMATTSVNISGKESLNNIDEIYQQFYDQIDYIVTDVEESSNVSSTVIDATSNIPKVLRQGNVYIK